jgi:hypothetical protein
MHRSGADMIDDSFVYALTRNPLQGDDGVAAQRAAHRQDAGIAKPVLTLSKGHPPMPKATKRITTPALSSSSPTRRALLAGLAAVAPTAAVASTSIASSGTVSVADDAELIALVEQHDDLWAEWPCEDDDPRAYQVCREARDLEVQIAITPAQTHRGLEAKMRVLHRADFDDTNGVVAAILQLDAERVGAGQ